ncbi:MAG: hypothetical protein KBS45_00235 [Clostridiales bacterium]|nr:hypothetical protein [Candidatus Coliplasma caballi]
MMCMKKMITGHKGYCCLIGASAGAMVGLLVACKTISSCQTGNTMKRLAKKAFRTVEENLGL